MKPVILAAEEATDDALTALRAGACGYFRQDISAEQLLKSLELVACGQAVSHRASRFVQSLDRANSETQQHDQTSADHRIMTGGISKSASASDPDSQSELTLARDVTRSLSRRELLILRMLTEGASNKVIAFKLVNTESTVKMHMKAILRKLRLQNRTQAAMWARNHVDEDVWISLSSATQHASSKHRHGRDASPSSAC